MDYQRLFNSEINGEAIKEWRAQGKKAIGTICCHVPVEIMHALDINGCIWIPARRYLRAP